jgi:hypothetical protein
MEKTSVETALSKFSTDRSLLILKNKKEIFL